MESINKPTSSRKKFILWGLGAVAFFSAFKLLKYTNKKKTVTMLTQEGKLVKVDVDQLPSRRKKVTNGELQNWVKSKK